MTVGQAGKNWAYPRSALVRPTDTVRQVALSLLTSTEFRFNH